MTKSALVIFKDGLSEGDKRRLRSAPQCEVVIAPAKLKQEVQSLGIQWKALEDLVGAGSIYEASAFAEELSHLKLAGGQRVSKSFIYKGYELWWINYNGLFHYFCMPYTQYRKLLEYLKNFQSVFFYRPPYKSLFSCYLHAYGRELTILREDGFKSPSALPFGVLLQILITLISIPVLMARKRRVMMFTGDKFEKSKDYDFRMKFIYKGLRRRKLPFVEFIRGLESWKIVIKHAVKRRRPVIYSEAATFVGRFASIISGGHRRAKRKFGPHSFPPQISPEERFKLLAATQYLLGVYDDIWAIRIMKFILRVTGVKVALIPAATERNFHSVLGCKLNGIPIVGILHGASSLHYNVYDFLPGFDGEKILSVDKYGLWSDWWKEYYLKNSKAYRPEQLYVSGPMRPLAKQGTGSGGRQRQKDPIKVLFISEQLAVPEEIMPYLNALIGAEGVSVYLTFRPYRDGFEEWLKNKHPEILNKLGADKILKNGINDAISQCDFAVGSHSTAVLEALFALKPISFFFTKKWGDYFSLKDYGSKYKFFAGNPEELVDCVRRGEEISMDTLKKLQERFFGDSYRNGSEWMVEEVEKILQKNI